MSIVLNIFYVGKDGNAKKFAEEMETSGVARAVREEKGNERYSYFVPLGDDNTILLVDKWANQEAIDAHHASPMMTKIAALREKYDLHMTVERFDENGLPDGDSEFVRK